MWLEGTCDRPDVSSDKPPFPVRVAHTPLSCLPRSIAGNGTEGALLSLVGQCVCLDPTRTFLSPAMRSAGTVVASAIRAQVPPRHPCGQLPSFCPGTACLSRILNICLLSLCCVFPEVTAIARRIFGARPQHLSRPNAPPSHKSGFISETFLASLALVSARLPLPCGSPPHLLLPPASFPGSPDLTPRLSSDVCWFGPGWRPPSTGLPLCGAGPPRPRLPPPLPWLWARVLFLLLFLQKLSLGLGPDTS